jgi:cytochrome c oxidase subunit 3
VGQLPGKFYTYDGIAGTNPHLFFSVYFALTGLHGIHVTAGMLMIGWLILRTSKGDFSQEYYTPVEMTGLYWHLVDLIWIYLFPLLYLVG